MNQPHQKLDDELNDILSPGQRAFAFFKKNPNFIKISCITVLLLVLGFVFWGIRHQHYAQDWKKWIEARNQWYQEPNDRSQQLDFFVGQASTHPHWLHDFKSDLTHAGYILKERDYAKKIQRLGPKTNILKGEDIDRLVTEFSEISRFIYEENYVQALEKGQSLLEKLPSKTLDPKLDPSLEQWIFLQQYMRQVLIAQKSGDLNRAKETFDQMLTFLGAQDLKNQKDPVYAAKIQVWPKIVHVLDMQLQKNQMSFGQYLGYKVSELFAK